MTREEFNYTIKGCGCFIYRGHIYYEESELIKAFEDMGLIEQEPRYCDRNICLKNEYNGIGCDDCEVTKSQESCKDAISRQAVLDLLEDTNNGWIINEVSQLPSVKPQDCDKCEVGNPCLYCKHEFKAQADRNEFYNWDAPIRHKADGEYISRKALLEDLYKRDYTKFTHRDFVALVQYQDIVAIPPEHDGCKDCVYQDNPQDAMPCRECKQNYMDKWKAKAKPYKGMTNGEVVKAVFPDIPRTLEWHIQNVTDDDWWNSPYSPQESEG